MQLYIFGDNFQHYIWHSCMLCHLTFYRNAQIDRDVQNIFFKFWFGF